MNDRKVCEIFVQCAGHQFGVIAHTSREREAFNFIDIVSCFPHHVSRFLPTHHCRINAIIAPKPTNTPPVTRLNTFATRWLLSVAPMRVPKLA